MVLSKGILFARPVLAFLFVTVAVLGCGRHDSPAPSPLPVAPVATGSPVTTNAPVTTPATESTQPKTDQAKAKLAEAALVIKQLGGKTKIQIYLVHQLYPSI